MACNDAVVLWVKVVKVNNYMTAKLNIHASSLWQLVYLKSYLFYWLSYQLTTIWFPLQLVYQVSQGQPILQYRFTEYVGKAGIYSYSNAFHWINFALVYYSLGRACKLALNRAGLI